MKKSLIIFFALILVFSFAAGCAPEEQEPEEESTGGEEAVNGEESDLDSEEEADEQLKVAVLLPGSIDDMGWNTTAYEALMAVEEEYDAEVSYVEGVSTSDMEELFRNYAIEGFDMIFGHGFEFGDPAERVAEDFPDTQFVVTSSEITNGENLSSGRVLNEYQGFLAGALAALITENDHVAAMGGIDIPPFRRTTQGFLAGAEYVDPDIQADGILIGTNDDPAVAYEQARSFIDSGADVIFANADQAGLGSIEACQEEGIWAIGANVDQNSHAPDTIVQSVVQDNKKLYLHIVEQYVSGDFEAKFYPIGIEEGGTGLADWHGYDEEFPEAKEEMDEIIEGLVDGSITFDYEQYDF